MLKVLVLLWVWGCLSHQPKLLFLLQDCYYLEALEKKTFDLGVTGTTGVCETHKQDPRHLLRCEKRQHSPLSPAASIGYSILWERRCRQLHVCQLQLGNGSISTGGHLAHTSPRGFGRSLARFTPTSSFHKPYKFYSIKWNKVEKENHGSSNLHLDWLFFNGHLLKKRTQWFTNCLWNKVLPSVSLSTALKGWASKNKIN